MNARQLNVTGARSVMATFYLILPNDLFVCALLANAAHCVYDRHLLG